MSYVNRERGVGATAPVRLEPGPHRSPRDGVCIVELASMIGGEPFSDRPDCVCPVLAAFLRGWNDRAGYFDRQRLRPYAWRVVGTGGYRRISGIRRDLCLRWAGADLDRGPLRRAVTRLAMRARIAWSVGLWQALRLEEGAGTYAARVCFSNGGGDQAFELLDRLLETAPPDQLGLSIATGNGNGNGHAGGNGWRDVLGIRATIIARESAAARSRGARESDSAPGADEDRPRGRRAVPPSAGS